MARRVSSPNTSCHSTSLRYRWYSTSSSCPWTTCIRTRCAIMAGYLKDLLQENRGGTSILFTVSARLYQPQTRHRVSANDSPEFDKVHWGAILQCIPAMFALTFFGILHVPINV